MNSLLRAFLRDVLSGEARNWTAADWLVLPRIALADVERIAVGLVLDHTDFGRALASEVLFRRGVAKARAIDAHFFCFTHDCDMKDCPKDGAHDDE